MAGHPDGNLSEPGSYSFPELSKEIPVLLCVLYVYEHTHQLVAVHLPGVLPLDWPSIL